ncbi:hypothetical protein [Micromonospora sp. NPDC093277]|uniref:hypothetical protein n=1 Tax=Micromonospora sp. NPDC093277 TaxID=3364291 RepID=UPI0037FE3231
MSWQPRTLGELPLVLAGPLLRRVDGTSVTVWLALRDPRKVTVRVYSSDVNGVGQGQLMVGTRNSVRVAEHCHLVAVTATGAAPLAAGTLFRYDVHFGTPGDESVPVPSTERRLYSPAVVAATEADARAALTYVDAGPTLPSFATPPADLNRLRMVHSSCRKPHGGGEDALAILDDILRADGADPATRPQQLVLTGGQIYADDVADCLLTVIDGTATALGAAVEALPGIDTTDVRLRPGHRQELVTGSAGFSTPAGKSHLLTLAEFWAMHLLVWSDVLWPSALPEFADVYPDEAALLDRLPFDVKVSDAWETLKGYGRAKELRDAFQDERKAVAAFRAATGAIRRVLANIPSYLVIGEHEVTEDWYATQGWAEKALAAGGSASGLGRRAMQNALAAYAMCQAWGNTPERFVPGEPGRALLDAVAAWDGNENAAAASIRERVGLPTGFNSGVPLRPAGALDWHFHVRWTAHQLIVLDTRTTRVFLGGPDDPPALLYGDAALKAQIGDPPDLGPEAATVVVSAAPVVGYPFISDFVQQMLGQRYRGRSAVDTEAWGLQRPAYEKVLARLFTRPAPAADGTRRQRIILLSGETGYGFAARLRYDAAAPFKALTPGRTRGVIAQFVSSAAHNEDGLTRFLHGTGFDVTADALPRSRRVGWANPDGGTMTVGTETVANYWSGLSSIAWTASGTPAVAETTPTRQATRTPDWSYDLTFIKHNDADPTIPPRPGTPHPVYPPTGDRSAALGQYLAATTNHDDYLGKWGDGKEVVGHANLGEVTLSWSPGDAKRAVQTLWWRLPGAATAAPLTRCVVDLSTRAAGPAHDPAHLVLTLHRQGADGSAATDRPAEDSWVYWRTGTTVRRLRAGTDGYLYASAGSSADPWDYTAAFTPAAGTVADVAYSTGARPLPDALLDTERLFQQCTVPPVPPADAEQPRSVAVPGRLLRLVSPAELDLWPVVWETPETYLTQGLAQQASAWTNTTGIGVSAEGNAAPLPPADHQPQVRGLRVTGQVDGAASEVKLRLQTTDGTIVRMRDAIAADAPVVTELTAVLEAAVAGTRTFTAGVFLADPPAAFGPVEIVVTAQGPAVPHVDSFTVHLCGMQLALVDDPGAAQRGPSLGQADERIVVDFVHSPRANLAGISAEARLRRMVRYQFRNELRPLPAGGGNGLYPQMPMWMGEVQFVGLSAEQLRQLLRRRWTRTAVLDPPDPAVSPPAPRPLRIDWTWALQLSWDGPDADGAAIGPGAARSHSYTLPLTAEPVVQLHYGAEGQFTDATGHDLTADSEGRLPGAFDPAPTRITFPVADRRLPAVVLTGQQRAWGRAAGATPRPTLVLEFQPKVTDAAQEVIRGGDGLLQVPRLLIDRRPVDPGLVADAGGTAIPPAATVPLLRLPEFRIVGTNPTAVADIEATIRAVVDDTYTTNQALPYVAILSQACWRDTIVRIFSHESGLTGGYVQFETRRSGRYSYERHGVTHYFGLEKDMPLFGPPHGYGIGQLDELGGRGATPDEVWSWVENIRAGVQLLMITKASAVHTWMTARHLPTPVDQRSRAIFQRECVRRYNGGKEFIWEPTLRDYLIQPSYQYNIPLDPTNPNSGPASGPDVKLLYPNQVLGTTITYFTSHTGQPNRADGANTAYAWPITFAPADYGPETA